MIRVPEAFCNGPFHSNKENRGMDFICAFCSADVYYARDTPLEQPVRLHLPTGDRATVEYLDSAQEGIFVYAVYKINDDVLVLSFKGSDQKIDALPDGLITLSSLRTAMHVDDLPAPPGFAEELRSRHGCRTIYITGHSLGGALAMVACMNNYMSVERCIVFNPGTGAIQNDRDMGNLMDWVKSLGVADYLYGKLVPDHRRITAHHIFGDPVSFLAHGTDTTNVHTYTGTREAGLVPGYSAHLIVNFTTLEMDRVLESRARA